MKKTLTILIALVIVISLANYLYCEHRAQALASLVDIGMTKSDVIRKCGKPTSSGQLIEYVDGSEKVVGTYVAYAKPYWWDIAAWNIRGFVTGKFTTTIEGYPRIDHSPKCQVEFFSTDGGNPIVSIVHYSRGYSDRSTAIKGTLPTE